MKKAMIGAAVMLIAASGAQAVVRSPDVFTDGARVDRIEAPLATMPDTSRYGRFVDEQFRKVAVRKVDPYTDGAVRQVDRFLDGGIRQVDPFTDGALARAGVVDLFTDGA